MRRNLQSQLQDSAMKFADNLAMAVDEGCNAVTYWQYAARLDQLPSLGA